MKFKWTGGVSVKKLFKNKLMITTLLSILLFCLWQSNLSILFEINLLFALATPMLLLFIDYNINEKHKEKKLISKMISTFLYSEIIPIIGYLGWGTLNGSTFNPDNETVAVVIFELICILLINIVGNFICYMILIKNKNKPQ